CSRIQWPARNGSADRRPVGLDRSFGPDHVRTPGLPAGSPASPSRPAGHGSEAARGWSECPDCRSHTNGVSLARGLSSWRSSRPEFPQSVSRSLLALFLFEVDLLIVVSQMEVGVCPLEIVRASSRGGGFHFFPACFVSCRDL